MIAIFYLVMFENCMSLERHPRVGGEVAGMTGGRGWRKAFNILLSLSIINTDSTSKSGAKTEYLCY